MKQRFGFFALCFVGLFSLSQTYSFFRIHLGEEKILRAQVEHLDASLAQEQFRVALRESEMNELKAVIARNLPNLKVDDKDAQFVSRNIASVVANPRDNKIQIDLSQSLFNEGQKLFNEKKYVEAAEKFSEFTMEYPIHERTVEAYYLRAESYYLGGKEADSLGAVKFMMTQFPENPLTGYSLLRMGQIMGQKNRADDARAIFDSVVANYKEPKLIEKAKRLKLEL